jgi:osmoprotectant transport system permease protein
MDDPGVLEQLWDYLSDSESWWGPNGITTLTWAHIKLSVTATAIACAIALPLAVYLGHIKRGGVAAVSIVNIGRAIPTFAVIALVFPLSLRYGFGLGFWPTCFALVFLAVPPIFTNAYTGIRDVDAGTVEAARGMGMTGTQVLRRVEIPNGLPLVLTGVRVAAVQVVATATLGALVGYKCLGTLILTGFARQDDGILLTGAIAVALLSLLTDAGVGLGQRLATPWLRTRRGPAALVDVEMTDEMEMPFELDPEDERRAAAEAREAEDAEEPTRS